MSFNVKLGFVPFFIVLMLASLSINGSQAQDQKPTAEEAKDRYAVPKDADIEKLLEYIDDLKAFKPKSRDEYNAHRTKAPKAIETAAKRILELEQDKTSAAYKKATGYLLASTVQGIGHVKEDEQKKILDQLKAHLDGRELGLEELGLAFRAAQGIENAGNVKLAVAAYTDLGKLFANHKDEQLAGYGEKLLGSARRVNLPGNQIELEGTTADGKEFNWKSYRGKVVLVDFWATWCGPCVRELPNVKENYAKYHDKGFEVVGISLDKSRDRLEAFIKDRELPWVCLFKDDAGWEHPIATHYGIMSIPQAILVDKEGKVVSMKARGEELGTQLEKLLGPAKGSGEK